MKKVILYIALIACAFSSCMRDDIDLSTYNTGSGVFVVCSGNFMYGNSSLSFYNPTTREVFNEVFYNANGFPLGDVAQSLYLTDSLAYIVINNSGKIYTFNPSNFIAKNKITGFTSPRYIHFINAEKAYVSDLYAKKIWIINPKTLSITGSVDVDSHESQFYRHSTEQMVQFEDKVFVSCWSFDDKILVINTKTDEWIDSIQVGLQPAKMLIDPYNQIWVYCDGSYEGSNFGYELPSLYRINASTREATKLFDFDSESFNTAMCLNPSGDTLFITSKDIFAISVLNSKMPETAFIKADTKNVSAIAIDASNGDFYLADAIDWMQNAMVYRYNRNAVAIDSFRVGINPVQIVFKK
ncbi:MAG: YncE family protein [Bacteroidales bacterium]|nr:YncE family protein [Bacteroidales bacterium]